MSVQTLKTLGPQQNSNSTWKLAWKSDEHRLGMVGTLVGRFLGEEGPVLDYYLLADAEGEQCCCWGVHQMEEAVRCM